MRIRLQSGIGTSRWQRTHPSLTPSIARPSRRGFATTAKCSGPAKGGESDELPRMYRYVVDVHGQLFLYDTVPKNLTSCFKDPRFLNFFFDRIKQLEAAPDAARNGHQQSPPSEWHEDSTFLSSLSSPRQSSILSLAREQGYGWISECQGEWNFVNVDDEHGTPVVFRGLVAPTQESENDHDGGQGNLTWGGDRSMPFQVDKLKVCSQSGYLYHPSPYPGTPSWQRRLERSDSPLASPFGPYSLISSDVVVTHFASDLDVDESGGTVLWQGKRWEVGVLREGDVVR